MIQFTDDALKRVKALMKHPDANSRMLVGLITRLEASEDVITQIRLNYPGIKLEQFHQYDKWLKVSGK